MTRLEDRTRQFWYAAKFYRLAVKRDRRTAVAILTNLAHTTAGKVPDRAQTLLKEIDNDKRHSPYEI